MLLIPVYAGKADKNVRRFGATWAGLKIPDEVGERLSLAQRRSGPNPVVLVSMGPRKGCDTETVRRVGGSMAAALRAADAARATIDMGEVFLRFENEGVIAICEGLALASFRFDHYLSERNETPEPSVTLGFESATKDVRDVIRRASAAASATNFARELAHEPANVINPVTLVDRAKALAKETGLTWTLIDEKQMKRAHMGGMLAVGMGSDSPPRLIVLEHGDVRKEKPVVLVGKAVTFDSGGYSIKDKNNIVGMKYDKCGGMTVLGVMRAASELEIGVPVVGAVAAAENMISSRAYRPNDIITTMSGKTVEIISTDAEGRMVLADALTWVQQQYKPRAIIDLATLTGGVVVALGKVLAGIFSNEDELRDRLMASGERTFERLWPLPMHDDYFEGLKSDDCDFKNSAGREGHASLAAVFLKQFVDQKIPWAHLDIAGVASIDKAGPYCPPGGTGFGVRLLCDYLERL
jgi:leucyl aminopeptidase